MTGSSKMHCVFCRCLRLLVTRQISRQFHAIRLLPAPRCVNGTRNISSGHAFFMARSGANQPPGEEVRSSSTSDSSSGESSGSESDSDHELVSEKKAGPHDKIEENSSLQGLLKATEKKKKAESNLKDISPSISAKKTGPQDKTEAKKKGPQDKTEAKKKGPQDKTKAKKKGLQDKTEAKQTGPQEKTETSSTLLAMLKAGEKKWGDKKTAESNLKDILPSVDKELVDEAQKLSKALPGDKTETESELIGQLLGQFNTTAKQKKGAKPEKERKVKKETKPTKEDRKEISEALKGITIQKGDGGMHNNLDRDDEKDVDGWKSFEMAMRTPGVGLFSGKPLGIFTKQDMQNARQEKKSLFEVVDEEVKEQLQFYPPSNAFEEQIQWTKEGKLWTFPIDNEAGWEEEKRVEFHEHVFLESQLSDFPKKGPIRHFMDLVVTALSKNPYLTVQQKHEHIDWYRNYFRGKQAILEPRYGQDGVIGTKQPEQLS